MFGAIALQVLAPSSFSYSEFYIFMVFFNCFIKYSNAVDQVMITQRNLLDPYIDNVSSTYRCNTINDYSCIEGDPCWFLNA